jgi:hypothetical protein
MFKSHTLVPGQTPTVHAMALGRVENTLENRYVVPDTQILPKKQQKVKHDPSRDGRIVAGPF